MGKIFEVGGTEFKLPEEMQLGVFMEVSETLADLVNDDGQVEMNVFMKFAADSQKMKAVVMKLLDPIGNPLDDKWDVLQKITLPQVVEMIQDFFVLSGQSWAASPSASDQTKAISAPMPGTESGT